MYNDSCGCGHERASMSMASAWGMLGNAGASQEVPPASEFDFVWEGLRIHIYQWGSEAAVPVVLLHGFMQTGLSWQNVAGQLAGGHCVYALDFVGHGKSSKPHTPESYAYDAAVRMVEAFLEEVACAGSDGKRRRAHVIGYSMGGRVAQGLVLSPKDLLYSLTLESCNFGPASEEERAAAKERNATWANKLRSEGIERFVEYWETLPLFATQREMGFDEVVRPERIANDAEAMALCLEGMGKHAMPNSEEAFAALASTWVPIKYLWGYDDPKSEPFAHRLEHEGLDVTSFGAGHNVHLEAPMLYSKVVQEFLSGIEPKGLNLGMLGQQQ